MKNEGWTPEQIGKMTLKQIINYLDHCGRAANKQQVADLKSGLQMSAKKARRVM